MRKLTREAIIDNATYENGREAFRKKALSWKRPRRIHLGEHITFLFETTDTIRYQVQEMLRIEGLSAEEDIAHEIATYNELIGEEGELGCTMLIEIDDPLQRDLVLRKWKRLPENVYLLLKDGERAQAQFDERQMGDDRLSAVQYLKFKCGESFPVAIGVDAPEIEYQVDLTEEQLSALREDLSH